MVHRVTFGPHEMTDHFGMRVWYPVSWSACSDTHRELATLWRPARNKFGFTEREDLIY